MSEQRITASPGEQPFSDGAGAKIEAWDWTGVADPYNPGMDYPTAWALQNEIGETLEHAPRCSSVPGWDPISGPHFLCDCGALSREHARRSGLEQEAFDAVASAHPHEVHDKWPDRFWEFFQRVRPGMSREDMVRILDETREVVR